jgi:hypothetical protein
LPSRPKPKRGRGGKSENEDKEPEGTKKKQQRHLVGTNDVYSNVLSLPVYASSDVTVVSPSSLLPASSPTPYDATTPFSNEPCPKTPPPRHRCRHTLPSLSKNAIIASGGAGGGGRSHCSRPLQGKYSTVRSSPLPHLLRV